jgi:SAM-dependent methyltransferase
MKYRESGMPGNELWETFYDPLKILNLMEIDTSVNTFFDIGCGYGTFLFPAAQYVEKKVIGLDIDEEMIQYCKDKADHLNLKNVKLITGDIDSAPCVSSLSGEEIDYAALFNILHCEEPVKLLKSVYNLLISDGRVGVIHWKYEKTPRGPSMEIRPKPEQIIEWAVIAGFKILKQLDLPPYHYGIILKK